MNFKDGQIIPDYRGEERWKIAGMIQRERFYKLLQVEDQAPDLPRRLYLMVLDYEGLPGKNRDFEISELRLSFHRMVEILCMNYTFLPEPVDLVKFANPDDPMDGSLRNEEPGLVFAQPGGFTPRAMTSAKDRDRWFKVKALVRNCSKTLSLLHENQVVIRAIPLHSIVLSDTTFKPYFFGFDSLVRMNDFKGYNPNNASLGPEALYSAPECFDPKGRLSPATDVYALGKLVLQQTLPDYRFEQIFSPEDPFPADIQNHINRLDYPPLWSRFLSLALNPLPDNRFQSAFEIERFIMEGGKENAWKTGARPGDKGERQAGERRGGPWSYQPNRQLPKTALVVWWNRVANRNEFFDFQKLYKRFAYKFNLSPRLFLVEDRNPDNRQNPFYNMLEKKFGMSVVNVRGKSDMQKVDVPLVPLLKEKPENILVVATSGDRAVDEFLERCHAEKWNILWVRAGKQQAPVPVMDLLDAESFIQLKRGKGQGPRTERQGPRAEGQGPMSEGQR